MTVVWMLKAQLGHCLFVFDWFDVIKCVDGKNVFCHGIDIDDVVVVDIIDETANFISKSEDEQGKSDDNGIIIW